jgi:Domain of unknown function (DUF6438)
VPATLVFIRFFDIHQITVEPLKNDFKYLTVRSAYRIVDFLRLQSANPVATSALRRQQSLDSERLGVELLVLVTVAGVVAAIMLLLRLLSHRRSRATNPAWFLLLAPLVLAAVVWRPALNVDLSHPRDLKSVTVELSRGPCFGHCPVYTIIVRGDGQVEYAGHERWQGHTVETTKSGTIAQDQVVQILRALDQVEFMTLDGRAFDWAYDTPSVGVRVSVDGKIKEVVSDSAVVGPPKGRQAQFVEAADKIATVLDPTNWSKCQGECRLRSPGGTR